MPERLTTDAKVSTYSSGRRVFDNLLREMRELSKKKSDAVLSEFKVGQINRVLTDMLAVVADEPEAKYAQLLSDDLLPQNADAVLIMCQVEGALDAFRNRYFNGSHGWRTVERAAAEEEDDEYDDDDDFGFSDAMDDEQL